MFPRFKTYDFRREGRIGFRHSKALWTLVIGEMFAAVSVILNRELALKNCKISGRKKRLGTYIFFVKKIVFKPTFIEIIDTSSSVSLGLLM